MWEAGGDYHDALLDSISMFLSPDERNTILTLHHRERVIIWKPECTNQEYDGIVGSHTVHVYTTGGLVCSSTVPDLFLAAGPGLSQSDCGPTCIS
jgi:hypothetical protein